MRPRHHQKPTHPFGFVSFAKTGEVERSICLLPATKAAQELAVAETFLDHLRRYFGFTISHPSPLPECGHDALIVVNGQTIHLQITEISPWEFLLPPGSADPGNPKAICSFSPSSDEAFQVNSTKVDDSIRLAVERKLQKHYSPSHGAATWLLVFTTSFSILTVYEENGKSIIAEPLRRAREFLTERSAEPFVQIWFSNLLTRPVLVWPAD